MNADTFGAQLQEMLTSVMQRGSRYQTEKLVTLGGYFAISIASLFWAFSGGGGDNSLGAAFDRTEVAEIDKDLYMLRNNSGDDWTNVRVVVNRRYLYKREELKANDSISLGNHNFDYFYYIPRAWGLNDWEQLSEQDKPEATAPRDFTPSFVQIRADQGRLDLVMKDGKGIPKADE